jgi:hypothetical protein
VRPRFTHPWTSKARLGLALDEPLEPREWALAQLNSVDEREREGTGTKYAEGKSICSK